MVEVLKGYDQRVTALDVQGRVFVAQLFVKPFGGPKLT
jgi:hypothetical protein